MSTDIPKERILTESHTLNQKFNENMANRELNDEDFKISMKSQYSFLFTDIQYTGTNTGSDNEIKEV